MVKIAVIGAGVVGMSTAIQLQEAILNAQITIFAEKFGLDTTSAVAAGLFRVTLAHLSGENVDRLRRWSKDSYFHYYQFAHTSEAKAAGFGLEQVTTLFKEEVPDPFYSEFMHGYRVLTDAEMKYFVPQYKYGVTGSTVITEGKKYLPWMMNKFKSRGGQVVARKVYSMSEFVGKYDLVLNCCALGAYDLVGDKSMFPVRGQVFRVAAPWIKGAYYADSVYIIPGADDCVVGGVRQKDNWNLDINPDDSESIWRKAIAEFPFLKGAVKLNEYAGLRPTRVPIRVEKEVMMIDGQPLKVVHNYGHGANGVSLSWGSSKEAVQLAKEMIQTSPKSQL